MPDNNPATDDFQTAICNAILDLRLMVNNSLGRMEETLDWTLATTPTRDDFAALERRMGRLEELFRDLVAEMAAFNEARRDLTLNPPHRGAVALGVSNG